MMRLGAIFLIAFCLNPNTSWGADFREEEDQSQKYKGAKKAIALMSKVGIGGKNVEDVAYFVDERMDGSEFRIHEGSYEGFTMKFQFNTEKVKAEGLEVKFTNESLPNWELKGTPEGAMINYHIEW